MGSYTISTKDSVNHLQYLFLVICGEWSYFLNSLVCVAEQEVGLNDYLPTGSSATVSPAMKNFSFTLSAGSPAAQQSSASTSPVFSLTQFGSLSDAGMILSECEFWLSN
jgi:hypothetical protein